MPTTRTVEDVDRDLTGLTRERQQARRDENDDKVLSISVAINLLLTERLAMTRAAERRV